jgi:hypothetical protein
MSFDPPAAASEAVGVANQPAQASSSSSADDIRKQVENEQALVDAQRKMRGLEEELERAKKEKADLSAEKDGAGQSLECFFLVQALIFRSIRYQSIENATVGFAEFASQVHLGTGCTTNSYRCMWLNTA